MTNVALCFPGQGSQMAGMAEGLLGTPLARELLDEAGRRGLDLTMALAGDADSLRATEVAQPALLLVELTLWDALPPNLTVVGVAGHSVGEYAACVAAGSLAPRVAMALVIERGRAMAAMHDGTMAALIGIDDALAADICASVTADGHGQVVVANHNAPGQVVISGSIAAVQAAGVVAQQRGARRVLPLRVSGAFHSPLMVGAAHRFAAELGEAAIATPDIPLVANVDGTTVRDAAALRERLARQLTAAVRWTDCVRELVRLGSEALIEVGPGTVLTGLARRIAPEVRALGVSTLGDARALAGQLGLTPFGPT